MPLLWSKPPSEITCPKCGANVPVRRNKNSSFQPKPYCTACGWNVERARGHLIASLKQFVLVAAFFAAYMWTVSDQMWIALAFGTLMLLGMGGAILTELRRLPAPQPTPPLSQPLTIPGDLRNVSLQFTIPRLNIVANLLIVLAATAMIFFIPRELNPAHRRLPTARHELLFVLLTVVLAAYQIVGHGIEIYRLIRAIWVEQHLAAGALMASGRITHWESGAVITYEFLDYASRLQTGKARDLTMALYEDMQMRALYDLDRPWLNIAVVGLQFHRVASWM